MIRIVTSAAAHHASCPAARTQCAPRRLLRALLLTALVLSTAVSATAQPSAQQPATGPATAPTLPAAARWLAHAEFDLGAFWLDARYHGDPVGAFPTFIGPDGCAWEPAAPCTSLAGAPEWIAAELGR